MHVKHKLGSFFLKILLAQWTKLVINRTVCPLCVIFGRHLHATYAFTVFLTNHPALLENIQNKKPFMSISIRHSVSKISDTIANKEQPPFRLTCERLFRRHKPRLTQDKMRAKYLRLLKRNPVPTGKKVIIHGNRNTVILKGYSASSVVFRNTNHKNRFTLSV